MSNMPTTALPDATQRAIQRIGWPLERVLFALAGTMTLLSVGLSVLVSPWFLLLGALVGVNQWLFVLVGACPASLILRRLFSLPSVVYPARGGPVRRFLHDDGSCRNSASQRPCQATAATKP
jgi:hypothetical protein